jgi:hypothetical protein
MDTEITRLTNVTWLRAPDRQVVAMRASLLSSRRPRLTLVWPSVAAPQPVPTLDWPATLFADEKLDN